MAAMFGPEAKHAICINKDFPELPNEPELMEALVEKLGPHADKAKLRYHIRACRGKVHWAVNSYFREVLSAPFLPGQEDFHRIPRAKPTMAPGDALHQVIDSNLLSENTDSPLEQTSINSFPLIVLENCFKQLDVKSLCSAAMACKLFRQVTDSDAIWQAVFQQRWGDVLFPLNPQTPTLASMRPANPASQAQPAIADAARMSESLLDQDQNSTPDQQRNDTEQLLRSDLAETPSCSTAMPVETANRVSWRHSYHEQHSYEASMRCPRCASCCVIVPIVYGFPSAQLLDGMRRARPRLILGGDHLIESCHVWACTNCKASFRSFPYSNVTRWVNDEVDTMKAPNSNGREAYTYEL